MATATYEYKVRDRAGARKRGKALRAPARDTGKTRKADAAAADKPCFDFYEILPGGDDAKTQAQAERKVPPDRAVVDQAKDEEKEKGKVRKGIWKLAKNVLTIALSEGTEDKRPENFDGKGEKDIVIELTKEEPKKEEPKKDK